MLANELIIAMFNEAIEEHQEADCMHDQMFILGSITTLRELLARRGYSKEAIREIELKKLGELKEVRQCEVID